MCLCILYSRNRQAARVLSQLKLVIRPMYSNPPVYGARLVMEILSDDALSQEWAGECKVRRVAIQIKWFNHASYCWDLTYFSCALKSRSYVGGAASCDLREMWRIHDRQITSLATVNLVWPVLPLDLAGCFLLRTAGDGWPYHCDALRIEGKFGEVGVKTLVGPRHQSNRHVLLHRAWHWAGEFKNFLVSRIF